MYNQLQQTKSIKKGSREVKIEIRNHMCYCRLFVDNQATDQIWKGKTEGTARRWALRVIDESFEESQVNADVPKEAS